MTAAGGDDRYQEVMRANVELHSRLAADYASCEPHFRPENVARVEGQLRALLRGDGSDRLLDLGCGTGFIIGIAKPYVRAITGVDVTQAMLDRVDTSGPARIELHNHDTGTFPAPAESYDLATAYSFLHHLYDIGPTLRTAYRALRPGGVLYADLEPNFYFWAGVGALERGRDYDPLVRREIEMVTYKDEDIERKFGVGKEVFNKAEYGKSLAGGFKEEDLRRQLAEAGFREVDFTYSWFLGQGYLINDAGYPLDEGLRIADAAAGALRKALPLSRGIFKYLGFTARK
jgi:ubiquinone/menaquinone biosynthesis C-methylase UbiE